MSENGRSIQEKQKNFVYFLLWFFYFHLEGDGQIIYTDLLTRAFGVGPVVLRAHGVNLEFKASSEIHGFPDFEAHLNDIAHDERICCYRDEEGFRLNSEGAKFLRDSYPEEIRRNEHMPFERAAVAILKAYQNRMDMLNVMEEVLPNRNHRPLH